MNDAPLSPPLSNLQAELLKLFSIQLPEAHLAELKKIMAKYLLEKARDKANAIWDEKGYNDEKLLDLIT